MSLGKIRFPIEKFMFDNYKIWFLVKKKIRHKNGFICLVFELKCLSQVYISMQNVKTIFGDFLEELKEFLEIF